eukprot:TRINITY_DN61158_c0_g1_i1.p1 TRINITY_DN61158_c0_g1~~TRINITY_DN61158_c0_g1_i1.p1  ORF type:complete len:781 (-),score=272.06 TRINITY_DN61158_c0_g1_i1:166-2508(-)
MELIDPPSTNQTFPLGAMAGTGVPMDAGEKCVLLLKKCCKVLDSFDAKKTTVDSYFQDAPFLKDKKLNEIDRKFIHQVFYGCSRYQKFLKLFVTSFMYKCPAKVIREEQTLYTVLAYLLFFRLEELGVYEFRQFLACGHGSPMALLSLMEYALSVEDLEKWVKVEWCKHYDVDYIERDIIGKLQSFAEELRPVIEEAEFKATGTVKASGDAPGGPIKSEKKLTECKPFNITAPRPRLVPEPEVISREIKAQPVPAAIHKNSLSKVEEEKKRKLEDEKAKVAAKYSPSDHFSLETGVRRDHAGEFEELRNKVEAERMAECTFQPAPAKPFVPPSEDAVVRHNAASVLREDALLKQKQAKEAQILKRYEQDLHDASEFHQWQDKMREKDHLEEEARVHQRIVEMQLAREGAIEAQEAAARRKHILAEHQREELQLDLQVKEREQELELRDKQQLVVQTVEERGRARVAEAEVVKERADRAENLRREKEAEFERKRLEDVQEMERRKDLIRQIRALEKTPPDRYKMFDPAEPPCQGLLEEMSLAELRERLKIVETQRQREVDEKRERQLAKKVEKQEELTEKAEMLAKVRERAREEQQQRHDQMRRQKQQEEELKQKHREQCILEVADKLQQKKKQKKEEELRLKRELKEISTKRQFHAANAEMVEAKAHAEQHAGLDREARMRQKTLLVEQRRANKIKVADVQINRDCKQLEQDEYKAMQAAVTKRVELAKAADVALKDEILKASKSARTVQKHLERRNAAEFGHSSNAYMKRVTDRMSVST